MTVFRPWLRRCGSSSRAGRQAGHGLYFLRKFVLLYVMVCLYQHTVNLFYVWEMKNL